MSKANAEATLKNALMSAIEEAVFAGMAPRKINEVVSSLLPSRDGRGVATQETIRLRLEYLRGELRAERISYDGLWELQNLVEYIDPGDVELLEAAGVPENN